MNNKNRGNKTPIGTNSGYIRVDFSLKCEFTYEQIVTIFNTLARFASIMHSLLIVVLEHCN